MTTRDPNVVTLREAAQWLGVSHDHALRMAADGDFPGLITSTHTSGKRRVWLVSVPRFNAAVHGNSGMGRPA